MKKKNLRNSDKEITKEQKEPNSTACILNIDTERTCPTHTLAKTHTYNQPTKLDVVSTSAKAISFETRIQEIESESEKDSE